MNNLGGVVINDFRLLVRGEFSVGTKSRRDDMIVELLIGVDSNPEGVVRCIGAVQ